MFILEVLQYKEVQAALFVGVVFGLLLSLVVTPKSDNSING